MIMCKIKFSRVFVNTKATFTMVGVNFSQAYPLFGDIFGGRKSGEESRGSGILDGTPGIIRTCDIPN